MSETARAREILLELSELSRDLILFRNNTGSAWQGEVIRHRNGSILIKNPRIIHFGLCVGSSDYIGWRSKIVTPDMVGERVALFAGMETKTDNGQRRKRQTHFIETVKHAGGLAGFVTSIDEARELFL